MSSAHIPKKARLRGLDLLKTDRETLSF